MNHADLTHLVLIFIFFFILALPRYYERKRKNKDSPPQPRSPEDIRKARLILLGMMIYISLGLIINRIVADPVYRWIASMIWILGIFVVLYLSKKYRPDYMKTDSKISDRIQASDSTKDKLLLTSVRIGILILFVLLIIHPPAFLASYVHSLFE